MAIAESKRSVFQVNSDRLRLGGATRENFASLGNRSAYDSPMEVAD